MEEEKLTAQAAVVAVLKDNIHGLELDERCTQIAAFNIALMAWKLAGYQALPGFIWPALALRPVQRKPSGVALAGDSDRLQRGMRPPAHSFKDAPVLASLINHAVKAGISSSAEFHELAPLLTADLRPVEFRKLNLK